MRCDESATVAIEHESSSPGTLVGIEQFDGARQRLIEMHADHVHHVVTRRQPLDGFIAARGGSDVRPSKYRHALLLLALEARA